MKMSHIISNKFIDYENRNIGIIEFSTKLAKNNKSLVLHPNSDEYDLFEYANIGDTIRKDKNSLLFTVSSLSKNNQSYKIHFSCDDYR